MSICKFDAIKQILQGCLIISTCLVFEKLNGVNDFININYVNINSKEVPYEKKNDKGFKQFLWYELIYNTRHLLIELTEITGYIQVYNDYKYLTKIDNEKIIAYY